MQSHPSPPEVVVVVAGFIEQRTCVIPRYGNIVTRSSARPIIVTDIEAMQPEQSITRRRHGSQAVDGVIPGDIVNRLSPVVLRTFSVQDFHRVDMRSIARDAGMSFATIYRHFKDKEALLFWFISHWLQELYPVAIAALETDKSPLTKLQDYLRVHLSYYESNPEVGRVIFMTVPLERWMRDDTYRADEPVKRLLAVIAQGQEDGEIRDDVSRVVIFDAWSGIFTRAFLMWEYRGRAYSLTGQWSSLCRILVGGIMTPVDAGGVDSGSRKRAGASMPRGAAPPQ
jgi:AcrR family transcriptional regulator